MTHVARFAAVAGMALAAWSHAAAGCASVPGGTELTIEQLGRVIFVELTTDRARDLVTFGGGVCLELGGIEVRIEAERMTVASPGANATIQASGAVVHAADWRLGAVGLDLDRSSARLEDVTLVGQGVVGRAAGMELDLIRGGMVARALEVLTPTVRIVASRGVFVDAGLMVVDDVVASTCDCPPATAPLRIEGLSASLTLVDQILVVHGGILVIDRLRLPLPDVLEVSAEALASIRIPVSVGIVTEGDRGWVLGLLERRDGAVVASGDLSFAPEADPRWSATVAAADAGSGLAVEARDGALAIAATHRVALAPDWDLVLGQRNEGGGVRGRLHDSSATVEWARAWSAASGVPWRIESRAALGAAVTAQRSGTDDVAHGRGRLAAQVEATWGARATGQASLAFEAGATRYAQREEGQAWLAAAPRWRLTSGPLSVDLQHAWRAATGTSPFDERIDRALPVSQTRLRVAFAHGETWRLTSGLDVRYDWLSDPVRPAARVGVERWRMTADVASPHVGPIGLAWVAAVTIEAAGVVDPAPDRDAFVTASVGAATVAESFEIHLAGEFGIGSVRPGVRSLHVGASAPLTFAAGAVVVKPYLAFDVWPSLAGSGAPRLAGHGLALTWDTCCGTLDVGYRSQSDGSVTTRLGFSVDAREPDLATLR